MSKCGLFDSGWIESCLSMWLVAISAQRLVPSLPKTRAWSRCPVDYIEEVVQRSNTRNRSSIHVSLPCPNTRHPIDAFSSFLLKKLLYLNVSLSRLKMNCWLICRFSAWNNVIMMFLRRADFATISPHNIFTLFRASPTPPPSPPSSSLVLRSIAAKDGRLVLSATYAYSLIARPSLYAISNSYLNPESH